jgi:hypothetical protein
MTGGELLSMRIHENLCGMPRRPTGQNTRWETLYALRRRANLKIPQLAEQLGYSWQHLYAVENGQRRCGPVLNDRLAKRFGYCDPLELEKTQPLRGVQPAVPPKVPQSHRPAAEVA